MKTRELTEVELCVLGAVWLRGPCSAYAIRREFADSKSSYWSSSAGSIYPVIKRLVVAQLVATKGQKADGRGTRDVEATSKGEQALRLWVGELPAWTGKAALDPIRARMNFLAVLGTKKAQLGFLGRAEANTRTEIGILKRELGRGRKVWDVESLTTLGALYELEGRMRWLAAVREALAGARKPIGRK
jgi:DNA-binding PadR family transcriptional regulator